jgi:hypothetical protein
MKMTSFFKRIIHSEYNIEHFQNNSKITSEFFHKIIGKALKENRAVLLVDVGGQLIYEVNNGGLR